ncbi:MAG: hypothetical protein ACRDRH_04560 [Pseudonocardia sp.]
MPITEEVAANAAAARRRACHQRCENNAVDTFDMITWIGWCARRPVAQLTTSGDPTERGRREPGRDVCIVKS